MELKGDPSGIQALKTLAASDKGYLKFLIGEARSNTDLRTSFKDGEGKQWMLRLDFSSGDLFVEPIA